MHGGNQFNAQMKSGFVYGPQDIVVGAVHNIFVRMNEGYGKQIAAPHLQLQPTLAAGCTKQFCDAFFFVAYQFNF